MLLVLLQVMHQLFAYMYISQLPPLQKMKGGVFDSISTEQYLFNGNVEKPFQDQID